MPTPAEIAAYVGAAAWIPQIGSWVYSRLVVPSVRIIPEQFAQIGFTSLGPIFNVRMAMATDRKDAIIDRLEVELLHEDGALHRLTWTGLRETYSEITDSAGNWQVVANDKPAIALKLSTVVLTEKFVRFQDLAYHERHRPLTERLISQLNYLKANEPDAHREKTLATKELHDLFEFYRAAMWWKPGRWTARFAIASPNKAKLKQESFEFSLASFDTDQLQGNIEVIRAFYTNTVMSGAAGFEAAETNWQWQNVPFTPSRHETSGKKLVRG